ncbi:MAG: hypothetical protein RBR71_13125 [Gudongella sp.]|nr:hypothetical protein [Gudongella sp.]
MKKLELRLNEEFKYKVIKKLVDIDGNKDAATLKLGCTKRQVNRMINGYKTQGKAFFIHGNRGRKPKHALSKEIRNDIMDLYLNKYPEANFQHFCELLQEHDDIKISVATVRNILMDEQIISPKATKRIKKDMQKKLMADKKKYKSKNEIAAIQEKIITTEDTHPRRPRSAYFGKMITCSQASMIMFTHLMKYHCMKLSQETSITRCLRNLKRGMCLL